MLEGVQNLLAPLRELIELRSRVVSAERSAKEMASRHKKEMDEISSRHKSTTDHLRYFAIQEENLVNLYMEPPPPVGTRVKTYTSLIRWRG